MKFTLNDLVMVNVILLSQLETFLTCVSNYFYKMDLLCLQIRIKKKGSLQFQVSRIR